MRWNLLAVRKERAAEKKQRDARAGRASSGNLSPGERQGLFERRSKVKR